MDVSGRILRAWMPAIHAGMTDAADGQNAVDMALAFRMQLLFHARRASAVHETLRGKYLFPRWLRLWRFAFSALNDK
jgi:hypothetical protein